MVVTNEHLPLPRKEQDQTLLWTCVASAHLQCVNNHYAKSEYKGMHTNRPGAKYIEKYSNTLQLLSLINDYNYITITGPV